MTRRKTRSKLIQTMDESSAERLIPMEDVLFNTAGGTQSGLKVAQELIKDTGADAQEEARKAAKRGVLSAAAEYIKASKLNPVEQANLYHEIATKIGKDFLAKKQQSPAERNIVERTVAVNIAAMNFLKATPLSTIK